MSNLESTAASNEGSSTSLPSDIDPVRAAEVFRSQGGSLKLVVQNDLADIVVKLYSKSIITAAARDTAMNCFHTASDRTVSLLSAVEDKIRVEPCVFTEFVKILESEPATRSVTNELVKAYCQEHCTQPSIVSSTPITIHPSLRRDAPTSPESPAMTCTVTITTTNRQQIISSTGASATRYPPLPPVHVPISTGSPVPTCAVTTITPSAGPISTATTATAAVIPQRNVSDEISSLVSEFQTLLDYVEQSMIERGVTVNVILQKIKHIPVTLQERLGDCFSRRIPDILEATSVHHLFITLSRLWDYLNPGLLEFLVNEFGSDANRRSMKEYLERLKEFRTCVTIGEYINASHGEVSIHSRFYYTKMVTIFGREWENKTLQDAEDYKNEACNECHFLSSFLARMSIRRSSIAIVFYFPCSIEAEVNRSEALFKGKEAEQVNVFVDDICVFDMTGQAMTCDKCNQKGIKGMLESHRKNDCPQRPHSCQHCGTKDTYTTITGPHDKVCPQKPVSCDKCDWKGIRSTLDHHRNSNCPQRPFECRYCGERGTYVAISGPHDAVCKRKPVPCPHNECDSRILRVGIKRHLEKCAYEEVPCKYAKLGCGTKVKRKDAPRHEADVSNHHELTLQTTLCLHDIVNKLNITPSPVTFALSGYAKRKALDHVVVSPSFCTSRRGYNMAVEIHTKNGEIEAVFIQMKPGSHDSRLKWPYMGRVTIELLNQIEDQNHVRLIEFNTEGITQRGRKKFDISGSLSDQIKDTISTQHLKDDTLFFKVTVEAFSHKSWLECTENNGH